MIEYKNMTYKFLLCEKSNGIGKIILNRPEVLNALSPALLTELTEAVTAAGDDQDIAVVFLTGMGKAFSAGADLISLGDCKLENGRVGAVLDEAANNAIEVIQTVPKVVIALVNGHCYTGALEIALACDLIVASEAANFGDTHVRWGFRPSWGMSQRLPRTVGYLKAKELSFTAATISAREAEKIGLVNLTVPADKLEATAQELARKIMANSLEAVAAYKQLYNRTRLLPMEKGLEFESRSEFEINDTESRVNRFRQKK
jgi:enoyl-CoA hydratase